MVQAYREPVCLTVTEVQEARHVDLSMCPVMQVRDGRSCGSSPKFQLPFRADTWRVHCLIYLRDQVDRLHDLCK